MSLRARLRVAVKAPLIAGTYFIETDIDSGGTATLSVDTNALPALSSVECATAATVPDDTSLYRSLMLFYPSSVGPQFTMLARGSERDASITVTADAPPVTASVCWVCDDPQMCTNASSGGEARGVFIQDTILAIPAGPALTVRIGWR